MIILAEEESFLNSNQSMEQLNSKVLLFGEYALLHNGMALVIPCEKYSGQFDFYQSTDNPSFALQSNEYLKKFCDFAASHMDENFIIEVMRFQKELEEGLFFRSNIPQGYGLGSSGALVAAIVLRYLKKAKGLKDELKALTIQKLYQLKDDLGKLESFYHGVSSGLDPLSCILNEPILYKSPQEIITTELPKPSEKNNNIIFLLNTHLSRSTSKMMGNFKNLLSYASFQNKFEKELVQNSNDAIDSLLSYNTQSFYQAVHNLSSFQIQEMKGFIPQPLQKKMTEGLDNGNYFLKICGAGGGGFLLGFTQDWETTQENLKDYDLEIVYSY